MLRQGESRAPLGACCEADRPDLKAAAASLLGR